MKQHDRGYTLIELLVVLIIAGGLASIILANATGPIQKAEQTGPRAEMKALAIDILEYRQKEGRFPNDELPDVVPEGIPKFKQSKKGKKTKKGKRSIFDYDHHCLPMKVDGKIVYFRFVRLVWFGPDGERQHNHELPVVKDNIGDDVVIPVSLGEQCP